MLCALIMAGGKGTRFWPLSTENKPKQFIELVSEKSMIQMTVDRIKPIIDVNKIFICTVKKYVDIVKNQLPEIPSENIIIEPESRNTASCIALSSIIIKRKYNDCNIAVLPSDHLIRNEQSFRNNILDANNFLNNNKTSIITFGIKPIRPSTSYGYIKFDKLKGSFGNEKFFYVEKFVEKPDENTAKKYILSKEYLWNSGMFVWNVDGIIDKLKLYLPDTYESLHKLLYLKSECLDSYINDKYKYTDKISIDYAVLEKSDEVYVIPSDIGWDDIGEWTAMERYRSKDSNGNIMLGDNIFVNSFNNIVVSKDKQIVVSDLENIYVLESENSIIVGNKDYINRLKQIKESVGL